MREFLLRSIFSIPILFAGVAIHGADGIWAVDADGNWSDAGNWSGGTVADGANLSATFSNDITADRTLTLDSNRTIGNLAFGDNGAFDKFWTVVADGGSTLTLARSNDIPTINTQTFTTISANLAGSNGLQKIGNGGLRLTGTNTYSGGTFIKGALNVASDASLGDPSGSVTIQGGTLQILSTTTSSRNIFLTSATTPIDVIGSATNAVVTLNGVISGATPAIGLRVGGVGTIILNAHNTYQGVTTVVGPVRATDGIGLPAASNLEFTSSGSFQTSGAFTRHLGTGANQVRWTNDGGFSAFGGSLAVQIGGNTDTLVWGSANFIQPSSRLLLNATSADSTVDFQNGLDLSGGTRKVATANNTLLSSDLAQISGPISNGNLLKEGPGTLMLTAANSYANTTISDAGSTLQIGNGGASGTLGTGPVSILGASTLAFDRNNAFTVANTITSSNTAGTIVQKGLGTTSLAGTMTGYTANVTITAGALLVNTTVGGIAPVIVAGGTLGGTGSLSTRPVIVNTGGTLAPGASIESLDTGSVSFTAVGSRFNAEIDLGPTLAADLLNVTGSITLNNSTLDIALLNLPASHSLPLTFLLINNDDADPVSGQFSIIQNSLGARVSVNYAFTGTDALGRLGDGNDITVTLTVPGDFDADGDVDGADFVAWQTNFPISSGATLGQGDADGDGDVDGADFVVWQTNFPHTAGPAAVPEPAAFALALTAGAMLLGKRRRT
jgi:autotransporter-associated beta strand protein